MIKIENVDIYGFEAAIRGMRNSYNSWDKSDSAWSGGDMYPWDEYPRYKFIIGENDLKLMRKLAKAGDDHAKVLRMINVTCDITAPLYWWKEFRTYRAGVKFSDEDSNDGQSEMLYVDMDIEINSCSTMHKIQAKEFTLDNFSHEHLIGRGDEVGCFVWSSYDDSYARDTLEHVICALNYYRMRYLETKDKKYWWQMIQLLPTSYNQKRTVQLNYQVLKNMYNARKLHRLDEWRAFCEWIEKLPYFKEICLEESE